MFLMRAQMTIHSNLRREWEGEIGGPVEMLLIEGADYSAVRGKRGQVIGYSGTVTAAMELYGTCVVLGDTTVSLRVCLFCLLSTAVRTLALALAAVAAAGNNAAAFKPVGWRGSMGGKLKITPKHKEVQEGSGAGSTIGQEYQAEYLPIYS